MPKFESISEMALELNRRKSVTLGIDDAQSLFPNQGITTMNHLHKALLDYSEAKNCGWKISYSRDDRLCVDNSLIIDPEPLMP